MRCLLCVKLLHEISILTKILSFSEAFGVRPKIPGLNIIHLKDNWRALILVLVQWLALANGDQPKEPGQKVDFHLLTVGGQILFTELPSNHRGYPFVRMANKNTGI